MIKKVGKYVFLCIASFLSIFPFLWMIVGATNASVDITSGRMIPGNQLLTNIHTLFTTTNIVTGIKNSMIITVIATILTVLVAAMAGYGFEIYKSRIKDKVMALLLMSMMVPMATLLIPRYRMFAQWGLLNTFLSVILPSMATAFLIFFFRQNTKSFSKEILQAARVDGLGEMKSFFLIYCPVMRSTFAAATIITFMNIWNSYLWPLVALQTDDKMTLPLIISAMNSAYTPDFGMIMVAIVPATFPTAAIFFIMQKSFVEGMLGSVK